MFLFRNILALLCCLHFRTTRAVKEGWENAGAYCIDEEVAISVNCNRRGKSALCQNMAESQCKNDFSCKKSFFGGFLSNFLANSATLPSVTCRCNNGLGESLSTRSAFCGQVLDKFSVEPDMFFTSSIRFQSARNIFDYYARELWNAIKSNMSASDGTQFSDRLLSFVCLFAYPQCTTCIEGAHAFFGKTQQYYICYDPRPCWEECSNAIALHPSIRHTIYNCLNGNNALCPNISRYLIVEKIALEIERRHSGKAVSDFEFCKLESVCKQKSISGGLNAYGNGDFVLGYPDDPWMKATFWSIFFLSATAMLSFFLYFALLFCTKMGLPTL